MTYREDGKENDQSPHDMSLAGQRHSTAPEQNRPELALEICSVEGFVLTKLVKCLLLASVVC